MTTKPENPSAFPVPGLSGLPNDQFVYPDHGMTLRDYFAAAALQGLLHSPEFSEQLDIIGTEKLAATTYSLADAMLAARAA